MVLYSKCFKYFRKTKKKHRQKNKDEMLERVTELQAIIIYMRL